MTADTAAAQPPPGAARVVLLVLIPFGCGYYLSYLFRTVNAVISPDLVAAFGLTPADLGFLTSVYFVTFASIQIPLGVILDRYGPRRVQSALLLFAAAGAAIFALAEDFVWLSVGRGFIGLGVACCLMSSFKANAIWWPRERLPLMNNVIMAFGAFGALSATAPVEALLNVTGWRDLFAGLAVVTALLSATTYFVVPERRGAGADAGSVRDQLADLPAIYGSAVFWRFAAPFVVCYAIFMSYQTLWAAPWLRDVAGLGRTAVAEHLLLIQVGMFFGVLLSGLIADRLLRRGIGTDRVFAVALAVTIVFQAVLALGVTVSAAFEWIAYALFASSTILCFAILTERFPSAQTGRVITGANLMMFVLAFAFQWGIGAIIGLFPPSAGGGYVVDAHRAGFLTVLAVQVVAFLYFVWSWRSDRVTGA